jgi:hypothetical protein
MNGYDLENQSWPRPIRLPPVQHRSYRDWNQRSVINENALQRSFGRSNNPATDSSQRTSVSRALQFDAATDVQWIFGTHWIYRADTPLACFKDRSRH